MEYTNRLLVIYYWLSEFIGLFIIEAELAWTGIFHIVAAIDTDFDGVNLFSCYVIMSATD